MFAPIGSICIALGSVVLDRPDQSGEYIAKDLAGGWAYVVADHDGDMRFRGQGVCAGGLPAALRCAFLAGTSRTSECDHIGIIVDTRSAHRAMVELARKDPRIRAAIGGRPVAIMTRPQSRASFQARSAAERAASHALQARQKEEEDHIRLAAMEADEAAAPAMGGWRSQRAAAMATQPVSVARARVAASSQADQIVAPLNMIQRLVRPLMLGAHHGLAAAGVIAPRPSVPRSRAVKDWLSEFDNRMAHVRSDLRDVGV